jgi:hypothetical protein
VSDERESLQRELAEAEGNLRLIQERMAEFVEPSSVPLQLVKEAGRWEARIAALRERLARGSGLYPMRAPVADFTGRSTEVAALARHLEQGGETAQIVGVRGLGGVGKTELALKVAAGLGEGYRDAQLMYERAIEVWHGIGLDDLVDSILLPRLRRVQEA